MRFFLVAAVAVLAFVSSCDAAVATETKSVGVLEPNNVNNIARSLRTTASKNQLDSEDLEDRSIEEAIDAEDRVTATVRYQRWYNADLTPHQVKLVLGFSQAEMTKTARELSQLYRGYLSFYTARHRNDASE
uniref:RxLR effector protein n=1 Tax=Phytophthora agathidicida TaxID=1642459 RepID=A0A7G4WI27_9STRA|nr:PaRXLR38 [Phytophthora agathidicida]